MTFYAQAFTALVSLLFCLYPSNCTPRRVRRLASVVPTFSDTLSVTGVSKSSPRTRDEAIVTHCVAV